MRLLECNDNNDFSLTRDFSDEIPKYAILSHTWGADTEEVTFRDLMDGTGTGKAGYDKIRFCGEQARRDGLRYFWVDTCCIDKSNNNELSEAINSMFRWYRNAARCYVYLSDVPRTASDTEPWESAFRKSRWFTRGWTLQELLAPASAEFFSQDREKLGSKLSLERQIREITGIPVEALRGGSLSDFGVTERMLWIEKRETTRKEDRAYSLLGIFDIYMPLIYGEGRESAFKRLREEIDKALKGTRHKDFSVAFSLSNVSETEHFVAREDELAEMHKKLSGDGGRHTIVLNGLGGIGKTSLSVAYAKRHRDNYSAIFWLNIKDEDSVKQSFAKVAKQILREHPQTGPLSSVDITENLDEVIDAVKAWLSLPHNTRWLMIYDNYDNPKLPGDSNADPVAVDIRKFLPESYQGSVIITTRSSQVKIGSPVRIRKLENICDSLKILSNASRREGLINDPDAIRLAEELDGLPLALATAGAYLDQVAISISDYLRLYKVSWAKLQKTSPELSSYEDRMLYSTWQLSFDHVRQRNELSAKLLHLWAYFDNQDIWFELLRLGDSRGPEWIRELTEDELSFNSAIRVLSDYGLVDIDISSQKWAESNGYSIHGCVHSWTVHILNQEWDYDLARLALTLIGLHIPETEANGSYLIQRRLLQHAARSSYIILNDMVPCDGMEWVFVRLGSLYREQGKLDEAEKMYQRALQGKEKACGPDHISTLNIVNNLGLLYADQGKLDKAEKMYQRALQGSEKANGPDHKSTLYIVNNLGLLYADQGKLDEAEKMYQQALQGSEKANGPDHKSTLRIANNLGNLFTEQGKLVEAEKMYQRALQGSEKANGPDHISTLRTVNNLGNLYIKQGKLDEAEKMYQRALHGNEKANGPDHKSTLYIVNNLGLLYADQGRLDEAEKMYQRALHGIEKANGPDHKSTLKMVNNLGLLYADQGKLDEAEKMYQRALHGSEKANGPDHKSTLRKANNLGYLYKSQGRLVEAEKMYQRALHGSEKANGPDHMSTLRTVNNLGILYKSQGKLDEAEKMYQRAIQGKEKVWGPDHISTFNTVKDLGNLYIKQGKLDEAEKMFQRALQGSEKANGLDHISTLNTVKDLGNLYIKQGKLDEAEKMLQKALQGYEKALGAEKVTSCIPALNAIWAFGSLFECRVDLEKARTMYSKALAGYDKVVGPDHPYLGQLQDKIRALDARGTLSESEGQKPPKRPRLS